MKISRKLLVCSWVIVLVISIMSCKKDSRSAVSGINSAMLDEAFSEIKQIETAKSLVVSYHDSIVREIYFGTNGPEVLHDVRSVTKSVTALLVGIAIDRGFILSADQPIGDFLSQITDTLSPEKASIKIRDLLTMSSGFEWEELIAVSGYNNWAHAPNQVLYVLDQPLVHQPGEVFTYNSGAFHLLSVILSLSTGMSTLDFAEQNLFGPLGIGSRIWETDNQGYNNGSAGLQISPYDMVKIGRLILDQGAYNGQQIVSPAWIGQLTSFKISTNNAVPFGTGYGYGWWNGGSAEGRYVFAHGWGGQFIITVPGLDLVVVATNKWSGVSSAEANDHWYKTIELIMTKIIPAFPV